MTTVTRCPLPHFKDPDRPRQPAAGVNVCAGHYAGLQNYIAEAPALDADLVRAYTAGAVVGEKVHTNPTPGLNLRDDILEARTWLHQVYRAWSAHVRFELQLSAGADPATLYRTAANDLAAELGVRDLRELIALDINDPVMTVTPKRIRSGRNLDASLTEHLHTTELTQQAATLLHHLDWLANQDDILSLHADLTGSVQLGRRIIAPSGARNLQLGECIEDKACDVLTRENLRCDGTLHVTLYPEDPSLPSPHIIVCDGCGKEYPRAKWLKLGQKVVDRQAANA